MCLRSYLLQLWRNSADLNNLCLASYIDPAPSAKILDLGCNDGIIVKTRVAGRIQRPIIYGVDIDTQKLALAKKNGLITIKADVEKPLPFKNNFFDIVNANQIIEHLINVDCFLSEIYRILKSTGYLVLATENLASWHNIAVLVMGCHPFSHHLSQQADVGNPLRLSKYRYSKRHNMHKTIFTLRSLKDLVVLHGFKVVNFYGTGYYPLPFQLAQICARIDPYHSAFIGLKARKN